ncbi:MAG: pentapeptide repeat-containing protein [Actinomycetota bacterium]|nr:pentapeptide repeat-containing protein [Actinomycetota bacterium]
MTAPSNRPDPPTPRPLSNWTILAGALVVLGVAAVVIWFVLLRHYGGTQIQLDAIRTAGTLVIGTGGAMALLLTARRQRYTELTLVHTTRDATERRITELYTKAADQLGSDKAPVRLAGLYALERLAQNTPEQRQTIVDVICAYLRMPYTPPDEQPPAEDALAEAHERYENRRQEQQVRLTAQNILSRNLRVVGRGRRRWWHRTPPNVLAWGGIGLDLAGAFLLEFSLANCLLDYANFTDTQFVGEANFETYFIGKVSFRSAQFTGKVSFRSAQFTGEASFAGAEFTGEASFAGAEFTGEASFAGAEFTMVHFGHAQFAYGASFAGAEFTGEASFRSAEFTGGAYFGDAQFTGGALFMGARFTRNLADFQRAEFTRADFRKTRFIDGASFEDAQFTGGANFEDAKFVDEADFMGSQFTGGGADYTCAANFRDTQFVYTHFDLPDFEGARVVASAAGLNSGWPPGWTTRPAKPDHGEDPAFLYLTEVEEAQPRGTDPERGTPIT